MCSNDTQEKRGHFKTYWLDYKPVLMCPAKKLSVSIIL